MESNIIEPIHIEFYGVPGCGKSTISHEIAKEFRKYGYKVFEPTYNSDHNMKPRERKRRKALLTSKYCLLHLKLYRKLRFIVRKNGYVDIRGELHQIVNIIPKIMEYSKREPAIWIWDEGLIQSSISLSQNSSIASDKNETFLFGIVPDWNVIKLYINIDHNTVKERIERRQSNDSRIEQEHDENKKNKMLKKFQFSCDQIKNTSGIILCKSEKTLEEDVNKILGELKQRLKVCRNEL